MPDFFVGPGIHEARRGLSWWETSKLLPYNRQRFPARHDRLLCNSIANSLSLLETYKPMYKPRYNTSFVSPRDHETRKIMVWNSSLKLSTTTSKPPHKLVQRWHENKLIQKISAAKLELARKARWSSSLIWHLKKIYTSTQSSNISSRSIWLRSKLNTSVLTKTSTCSLRIPDRE